jgi:hypothetical protein
MSGDGSGLTISKAD